MKKHPQIKLTEKSRLNFVRTNVDVPGQVWSTPAFKFLPSDFHVQHPNLKDIRITSSSQRDAYSAFVENPHRQCTYAISSDPDGSRAMLFAAHLLDEYLKRTPNARPIWCGMHKDYRHLVKNEVPYSFLVISGVYPTMTASRVEQVKNLLDFYHGIPRLIVSAGEDPVACLQGRLYVKPTHLFYAGSKNVRRETEVI